MVTLVLIGILFGSREVILMNIVLIAHDSKKELMTELCIAYKRILSENKLYATGITAKFLRENAGLELYAFLPGDQGGVEQVGMHITYNDIDMVIFLRNAANNAAHDPNVSYILHLCDENNIPVATNIATAELLIHGLERGNLAWRELVK